MFDLDVVDVVVVSDPAGLLSFFVFLPVFLFV